MANYANLKAAIDNVIKTNGQKEITGEVLNQTLNAMVNSLGAGYQFAGVATPSSNPGTPDQNVFYFATQAGTYSNFSNIVLPDGISILVWNGSWSSSTFSYADGVFDISAYHATGGTLATYADLSAALGTSGANIPEPIRKGGMSVKFVQSSDNKYVQYRLMANSFTTDVTQWQGVNDKPFAGSKDITTSGGVYNKICEAEAFLLSGLQTSNSKTLNITQTTQVSTGITLQANKKYVIYVQANGCTNAVDGRSGLIDNNGVFYNIHTDEFAAGQYVEYLNTTDQLLSVRTLTTGVTVNISVYEKYERTLKEVDNDVSTTKNDIQNLDRNIIATDGYIEGKIVANDLTRKGAYESSVGNWVDTNNRISSGFIPVKLGDKIEIKKLGTNTVYFSVACFNAAKEIIVGSSVATTQTTIIFNVPLGVAYVVLSTANPDTTFEANISNSLNKPYGFNNKVVGYYNFTIPSTTQQPYQIIKSGFYKCYLKAQHNGVFIMYIVSNDETLHPYITVSKNADWSNGEWFDLDVPNGYSLIAIRIQQIGVVINEFSIYEQQLIPNNTPFTQWHGKKLATYGDSITAINNGDFQYPYPFQPGERQADHRSYTTWGNMVGRYHKFANVYGRGIGSQKYAWLNGGGAVAWVTPTGDYIARDNTSNKDNFDERLAQGLTSYPTGVTAEMEQQGTAIRIRGCGCSWSRITGMFPASIKDTIDVVTIMFYNDHENSIGQETGSIEWITNNNVDAEWANSSYYADYGGDYNIRTIRGAIASTIMKFQAWMPNTILVIMTPQNGIGRIDPTFINSQLFTETSILNRIVKEVREVFSIPLIDYYAESGINMLDGDRYLEEDSIHPYPLEGQIMFARCVIGGLNGIMPQIYRELIVT